MQISKNIQIIEETLYLENEKILILNDPHIGYEQVMHFKGILVPRQQLKVIITKLEKIIKHLKPNKIIINGDLKHEFGKILDREWKEVLQFLDFLLKHVKEVIVIQGNHDPVLKPVTLKRGVNIQKEYRIDNKINNILITHGDALVETDAETIIIGHEHPAITLKKHGKVEKFKCFLKGKWKNKELIVVPSFNPLLEGTDVLEGQFLSPFLNNVNNFNIFIVNKGEVFNFGKLKNLKSS
jgi:hypothetical protein